MKKPIKTEQLAEGCVRLFYRRNWRICASDHVQQEIRNAKGELHSINDEPAEIRGNGDRHWFKNGKRHRDGDLPAIDSAHVVDKEWWKNGQLHRDGDQPAVVWGSHKAWYKNGEKYRETFNGYEAWFKNGQRHRDGNLPAVIHRDGRQEWFKNGVQVDPPATK